jgi:hypothetical protein
VVGGEPTVHALDAIPMEAVQVCLHGVKWMISRGSLDGLSGDLDCGQNSLPLKPFWSEPILVIGPLPLGDDPPGLRTTVPQPNSL